MFQNVNPGLSRRFDIANAFHFEDFTDSELETILEYKLKLQDLKATDEAKKCAVECLSRVRARPNFGNAGEVENILGLAKGRSQTRLGSSGGDIILQPSDFDPDFNRSENAGSNLEKLFEGVIACDHIISKLRSYQNMAGSMKKHNIDPRTKVPMNFIFKGPPGTGKTTVARKMGQVYYDMGLISSKDVIECSSSDLVGQYVGQTGPKTLKTFERALGKVLFIDEAYRLAEGHFAQEAMDELVGLLTNERFKEKMVVILAGYDQDINQLLQVNSGLSSRFPETISFKAMDPVHCLEMLDKSLAADHIQLPILHQPSSASFLEMVSIVEELSGLSSWGNARDIKTLAAQMARLGFEQLEEGHVDESSVITLSEQIAISCLKEMLEDRKERLSNVSIRHNHVQGLNFANATDKVQPPNVKTTITSASASSAGTVQTQQRKRTGPQKQPPNTSKAREQTLRDQGVSDEVWNKLQQDKRAFELQAKKSQDAILTLERKLKDIKKREEEEKTRRIALEAEMKRAKDEDARNEAKRKLEQIRLKELNAKRERERKAAKLAANRKAEDTQRREEANIQAKLRQMGVCVAGFRWIPSGNGYRCEGGSHFVSNSQLGVYAFKVPVLFSVSRTIEGDIIVCN